MGVANLQQLREFTSYHLLVDELRGDYRSILDSGVDAGCNVPRILALAGGAESSLPALEDPHLAVQENHCMTRNQLTSG